MHSSFNGASPDGEENDARSVQHRAGTVSMPHWHPRPAVTPSDTMRHILRDGNHSQHTRCACEIPSDTR